MAQGAGGLMVSVSGVRGRVGEALTPEVVARYAAGVRRVGAGAGAARARSSSDATAVCPGRCSTASSWARCRSVGCDVIDIGLTTTPTLPARRRASSRRRRAGDLGQPQSDRVERAQVHRARAGSFSRRAEGAAMRALVETGIPRAHVGPARRGHAGRGRGRRVTSTAVLALPFLDVEAIRRRRFKVALDCVRGAGATIMPQLLERARLRGRRDQPRAGRPLSARHRSRSPRTSASSSVSCARAGADDRASRSIRTSTAWRWSSTTGRAIGEDYTLALAARVVLRHRRGPVVTNLSTSRIVDDVARRGGSRR